VQEWRHGEVKDAPFCPCLGSHLFTLYRKWCDATGERSPRSQAQFIGTIKNMTGWKAGQPIKGFENLSSTTIVNRKMIVPPDKLLSSSTNVVSKESKTQAVWLTECFFKFAIAGGFML
jgi:phage/plasmid-associated DNA primase